MIEIDIVRLVNDYFDLITIALIALISLLIGLNIIMLKRYYRTKDAKMQAFYRCQVSIKKRGFI